MLAMAKFPTALGASQVRCSHAPSRLSLSNGNGQVHSRPLLCISGRRREKWKWLSGSGWV